MSKDDSDNLAWHVVKIFVIIIVVVIGAAIITVTLGVAFAPDKVGFCENNNYTDWDSSGGSYNTIYYCYKEVDGETCSRQTDREARIFIGEEQCAAV